MPNFYLMMNNWLLVCFGLFISEVYGSLNLYINSENAKKLIGVPAEVWYVRDGDVMTYAFNYVVKVPSKVNILTFHWQNQAQTTMPYSLDISIGNSHAIQNPRLININRNGVVPRQLTAWSITLNCTGQFITQSHVNITLQIPITHSLQNITTLVIQRKKICTERANGIIAVEPIHKKSSTNVVYITLCFLALFLILVAALAAINHIKNNKRRLQNQRRSGCISTEDGLPNNQRLNSCQISRPSLSDIGRAPHHVNTTSGTTTTTTITSPDVQFVDPRELDVASKLKSIKMGFVNNLSLTELEMEGTFGRVHRGSYLLNEPSGPVAIPVIVKTVSDTASEVQQSVLIIEALMLAGLTHKNLLAVVAANAHPAEVPFIVFQCNGYTNLKKYLHQCHTLLTREVVSLGSQVLEALSYMHAKLLLHKDVGCRNCVVSDSLQVKLTDCALARDIFPGDYHCLGDNENRPVKWLAIESLIRKTFSPAADVWSWGVLVWEVMTLGQQPYVEIDPFEMSAILNQGVRLAQPINCPDELFKAMTLCWTTLPSERPPVEDLLTYLRDFLEHLDRYV